jgi:hypothetical protein
MKSHIATPPGRHPACAPQLIDAQITSFGFPQAPPINSDASPELTTLPTDCQFVAVEK